jgi:D-alanine-D-alanine ligase
MGHIRKRVGLLFGGRSAEHNVSLQSAANVLRAIDPDRYEIVPIGIDRDGRWLLCNSVNGTDRSAQCIEIPQGVPNVALIPGSGGEIVFLEGASASDRSGLRLDVVFPVLHGPNGEDGTVQGLLELARVPFVGSGVLGSAVGMDKDVSKRLLRDGAIPIVPFLAMTPRNRINYQAAVAALGSQDLFVKPANMGSSVGISRITSDEEYDCACQRAFGFDGKLLVEQTVAGAREIECSVLEYPTGDIRASPPGAILPSASHGFYTYDAKYVDPEGALFRTPADLCPSLAQRIQDLALAAFRVLACEALARVDFFVDADHEDGVFVNEVNTMPGFTAISMYPKLWEAGGLPPRELVEILIAHALTRHERRNAPQLGVKLQQDGFETSLRAE